MKTGIADTKNSNGWELAARPKRSGFDVVGSISALLPTAIVLNFGKTLPAWVWMWAIAFALFMGAKWVTILTFLDSGSRTSPGRLFGYGLLWPGMDIRAFCGTRPVSPPTGLEWAGAIAKTLLGALVVWGGVRLLRATNPIFAGWIGMAGLVLLLHFGLFHLLSAAWRAFGICARPIMHSPLGATSLSKFWGESWNRGFSDLMHQTVSKPFTKSFGAGGALLLVFLISGVLHELVISVPAHAGYALPTVYFILQGLALLFERGKAGRKLGLGSGWIGWGFVALVAGIPAFGLFYPFFVHRVILPMLDAIGAT